MVSLAALHRSTRERMAKAGIEAAELDARLVVEHFTGSTRIDVVTRPDEEVRADVLAAVEAAVARRIAGESVHRILGFREFYGLRLALSKETLEPRPDTETLVDAVMPFVRECVARTGTCRILDVGTGTGAIALALLHEVPEALATGVDISRDALATATANARANGLDRRFAARRSRWFEAVDGRFDVIVSNPPYISSSEIATLAAEVRDHDPRSALDGGPDGLDAYRAIAESAGNHLEATGVLGMEIGFDQSAAVVDIFAAKTFNVIGFFSDFGGNCRVILFQNAGNPHLD